MNSINLVGRWTKDVECKTQPSKKQDGEGFVTCRGTLAVQSREKNADGDYIAYFFEVTATGKTAEIIANNSGAKGTLIGLTGFLKSRKYDTEDEIEGVYHNPKTNKDGLLKVKAKVTHYVTEVVATEITFCQSKDKSAGSNNRPLSSFDEELVPVDDGDIPF